MDFQTRSNKESKLPRLNLVLTSTAISVTCLLVVLSFKQYFFYVPFLNGVTTYSAITAIALVGWIALITVPPFMLRNTDGWSGIKHYVFLGIVSLWTIGTLAVKIYTLINFGTIWANYLVVYPVLALPEWLVPIFYVVTAMKLKKQSNLHTHPQSSQALSEY